VVKRFCNTASIVVGSISLIIISVQFIAIQNYLLDIVLGFGVIIVSVILLALKKDIMIE